MFRSIAPAMAALFLVVGISGCRGSVESSSPSDAFEVGAIAPRIAMERAPEPGLEVRIEPKSGSKLGGIATFRETADGVRVVLDVHDVAPGKHGVHVHEKGDCSSADAKSAGEHFSPENHPHALPPDEPRHLGDFGNLEVKADGTGHLEVLAPHATLKGGDRHSFLDRALVVHAKTDDGSQPSGNSGERIGCGEIRRVPETF
jgi:Cu-Zn family superoxide dismutase